MEANILSKKPVVLIVYVLLFVILGGIAVYGIWTHQSRTASSSLALAVDEEDGTPFVIPETKSVTAGMRGYENAEFRFSVLFPETFQARQYQEKGNAMSVIFEEPDSRRGFQIYVTPYADTQITEERFRLDQPSGIMDQPTDIVIDGVRATMFYSKNPLMGEVREVWFINNGFLYEVVTYKELDEWLSNIMQTWKFI
jgi:hypothetical protein